MKACCVDCDYKPTKKNTPRKRERRAKLNEGLKYCSGCNIWLPKEKVKRGKCKEHRNEDYRKRYKNDARFRKSVANRNHFRKRNVDPIPIEGQENILEEFDGLCAYCDNEATTWDHIIPISKGGKTVPWNIVPACASCNSSKKNSDLDEWLQKTGRTPKYEVYERLLWEHQPIKSS